MTTLFDSVLKGSLESLIPLFNSFFSDFEVKLDQDASKNEILFDQVFSVFPEQIAQYTQILATIISFAQSNTNDILTSLSTKFKQALDKKPDSDNDIIKINSLSFNMSIPTNFHYLRFFTLFLLTDIIYGIIQKIDDKTRFDKMVPIGKIILCGFSLCKPMDCFVSVHLKVIDKWSKIFLTISTYSSESIMTTFLQQTIGENEEKTFENIFKLVSRAKPSSDFLNALLIHSQQSKKKKTLTSKMLISLADLIQRAPCTEKVIESYYSLAISVRTDKDLKEGALMLMSALTNRIPRNERNTDQLLKKRIFAKAKSHFGRSIRAWLYLVRGDCSECEFKDFTPVEFCFGYGYTNDASNSFIKYFNCVDFEPEYIRDYSGALVQLACIDFWYFSKYLIPVNLKLNQKTRSALYLAVAEINKPNFRKEASSYNSIDSGKLKKNVGVGALKQGDKYYTIKDVNSVVKNERALDDLRNFFAESASEEITYINIGDIVNDYSISSYIESNNLPFVKYPNPNFSFSEPANDYLVHSMLICLPYIFDSEDLKKERIVQQLLRVACFRDIILARAASTTIDGFYNRPDTKNAVIDGLIASVFEDFNDMVSLRAMILLNKSCADLEGRVKKVECACFICLTSSMAALRHIALNLLRQLSDESEGLYTFLRVNIPTILENVAINLPLIISPSDLFRRVSVDQPPRWDLVGGSQYLDFWYFYIKAFVDVMIDTGNMFYLNEVALLAKKWIEIKERGVFAMILYIGSLSKNINKHNITNAVSECLDADLESFIEALPFLHMNVLQVSLSSIENLILSKKTDNLDFNFDEILAASVSRIVKSPDIERIIFGIISILRVFIGQFQRYLSLIGISPVTKINWADSDNNMIAKLKEAENFILDYCTIVFTVSKYDLNDDPWDLSSKQNTASFLINCMDFPGDFERIKRYCLCSLIPLIQSGTLFRDGFEFDTSLLGKLVDAQIEGYQILEGLLLYHSDILVDEYVRQYFLRKRTEAELFLNAILVLLSDEDAMPNVLSKFTGSLLLLSQSLMQSGFDNGKELLSKVGKFFMTEKYMDSISDVNNFEEIPSIFEVATEQAISIGLDIISKGKISSIRTVSKLLTTWFKNLRLLPTHSSVSKVPDRFRVYNVISFLQQMDNVSASLEEEQFDYFSDLWLELLSNTDNSKVCLAVIFESENDEVKQRVFTRLLAKQPSLIVKFLVKRCKFSYWYFVVSNCKPRNYVNWMVPVLNLAFTDHLNKSAHYVIVVHFALLHFEHASSLLDTLYFVVEIDMTGVDPSKNLYQIASAIYNALSNDRGGKHWQTWQREAVKWAVSCNDIKIATRSMTILNAIERELPSFFLTLLKESVLYFLTINDDPKVVGPYICEVFRVLSFNVANPQFMLFSIDFASKFLNYRGFQGEYMKECLPLFMYASEKSTINQEKIKNMIVDSFIPYLHDIEINPDSQNRLMELVSIFQSPELSLISSILQNAKVIKGETNAYNTAIGNIYDPSIANKCLLLLSHMFDNSSQPLAQQILTAATDMLSDYRDRLSLPYLRNFANFALSNIVQVPSANVFLKALYVINPSIINLDLMDGYEIWSLDDVRAGIEKIEVEHSEVLKVTDCKDIRSLTGMISQRPAPKVFPFTAIGEMITKLELAQRSFKDIAVKQCWSSDLKFSSRVHSNNKVTAIQAPFQVMNYHQEDITPIPIGEVILQRLDLPTNQEDTIGILVSPADFAELQA